MRLEANVRKAAKGNSDQARIKSSELKLEAVEKQKWSYDLRMKPGLTMGQIVKSHYDSSHREWKYSPLDKANMYKSIEKKAGNDWTAKSRLKDQGFAARNKNKDKGTSKGGGKRGNTGQHDGINTSHGNRNTIRECRNADQ